MIIEKTKLPDVWLIKPDIVSDFRGDYVMIYNQKLYQDLTGVTFDFVEHDISTSTKGILRGIHYSPECWKLNECFYGKLYYVVVNCDNESLGYGQWQAFILSAENRHQILKHPRYGSGFYCLSDFALFHYRQTEYYNPDTPNQKTFHWRDNNFGIWWPDKNPLVSKRDEMGHYEQET